MRRPTRAAISSRSASPLFEALHGEHPFAGATAEAMWAAMAAGRVKHGAAARSPRGSIVTCAAALAVEPAAALGRASPRFADAIERPPRRTGIWLAGAGTVAVASLVVAIVALVRAPRLAQQLVPAAMPDATPSSPTGDSKKVLEEAGFAGMNGEYHKALELSQGVLANEPNNQGAMQVVTITACAIHYDLVQDKGDANQIMKYEALARTINRDLDPKHRGIIHSECDRDGIWLEGDIEEVGTHKQWHAGPTPPPRTQPPTRIVLNNIGLSYTEDPAGSLAKIEAILVEEPRNTFALRLGTIVACELDNNLKHNSGTPAQMPRPRRRRGRSGPSSRRTIAGSCGPSASAGPASGSRATSTRRATAPSSTSGQSHRREQSSGHSRQTTLVLYCRRMSDVDRLVELITQRVQERLQGQPRAKLNVLPRDRGPCDDDSAPGEDCASCGSCVVRRPWSVRAAEEAGLVRVGAAPGVGEVPADLAKLIDHTLLKPEATRDEIVKLCEEAKKYHFASVCVNTTWVPLCKSLLANTGVMVCTVVGFPLGAMMPTAKAYEARDAVRAGAQEVDMVINIGALKSKDYETVFEDICRVVKASAPARGQGHPRDLRARPTRRRSSRRSLSKLGGAAFVKTSTGSARAARPSRTSR